jgi:hypothetical protein
MDAVATEAENGPDIGFNSAFPYDFNPANGITPGQTDFEALLSTRSGTCSVRFVGWRCGTWFDQRADDFRLFRFPRCHG